MTDINHRPRLSIVVAQAEDQAIGIGGDMPWHLSADLKHFKSITMGHPVVMGRHTWESLPVKPLAGRRNIVLSQSEGFSPEGAEVVRSVNDLFARIADEEEAFIIGGSQLYALLMPWVDRLYVTWVHRQFPEADTFFPVIDRSTFALVNQSERKVDERSGLEYSFAEYSRKYGR